MSTPPRPPIRQPARVPGFAPPRPVVERSDEPQDKPGGRLDRHGPSKQLNVRIVLPLLRHYHDLVRGLTDDGYRTSLAELVHAVLHQGPATPEDARKAIRDWRRATDPDA